MPAIACTAPGSHASNAGARSASARFRHGNVSSHIGVIARHQTNDRIGFEESRCRLPQWTCRQQHAVAQLARCVNDDDFHGPRERVVLQAIVGDHHIDVRLRCNQRRGRRRAPAADPDRQPCFGIEQRLVADDARIVIGHDRTRHDIGAAVTSTHDSGMATALGERVGQRERQRRLAGAADIHVADDDNGDAQRPRTK
jgi:hypothetical protein